MITLYNMDVMKALKQMPSESVDMQITSPPYWGLRDYGEGVEVIWDRLYEKINSKLVECEHEWGEEIKKSQTGGSVDNWLGEDADRSESLNERSFNTSSQFCSKCQAWKGQLGLEPDFELFIKHLCDVFDEVKRVLKRDGTCWVNLGDTYSSAMGKHSGTTAGFSEETNVGDDKRPPVPKNVPAKCLCAIPERFMLEMIKRGWILRNKIIWHKPNHMPTSVKDRFANSWEYLFMFSKSKKYYFDLDAVREPHQIESLERRDRKINAIKKYGVTWTEDYKRANVEGIQKDVMDRGCHPKGKNPDDIIQIPYAVVERDKEIIEYRNLPDIKEFANYINGRRKKLGLTIEQIEKEFGNQASHHWFNAESFPSKEDYERLKLILELDGMYDNEITTIYKKPAEKQNNPLGKNPSDFWNITTQPYPESHFAVFPEKLVERPIKTTPKQICNKCGKARERITENEFIKTADAQPSKIGDGKRNPETRTDLPANRGYTLRHTKGWTSCSCNAGFHPAVILDIFGGSGTTAVVARKYHRDCILTEIKKEYCDLIYKRLFGNNQTLFNQFKLIK